MVGGSKPNPLIEELQRCVVSLIFSSVTLGLVIIIELALWVDFFSTGWEMFWGWYMAFSAVYGYIKGNDMVIKKNQEKANDQA